MRSYKGLKRTTALAIALGLAAGSALAVHDTSTFELEGNAVQDSTPPPDDWATLYGGGGAATVFTGIVKDKNGADDIFTGGGSKTPNLIADWQWKTSPPPPDKNNITNAYAANYVVAGEQVIYFGADLFADNGDAELAFWFFQDDVQKSGSGFIGEHMDGDVYVAVKFSNGGTQSDIAVYEWWEMCDKQDVPGGNAPLIAGDCAADNIRVVIPLGPATCGFAGGDQACAITNGSEETAPWPYIPKSGTSGKFPPTTFFEGGINIFDVFGENKCFSSFMASTGASTSFTATAKDFALGDFNVCSVDVSKTCVNDSEADDTPTAITYNVRGCGYNDGGGAINISSLLNSINGGANYTPTDLTWYNPGMVDDGMGGTRPFNPTTDCNDPVKLAEAIASGTGVGDPISFDLAGGAALVYEFSETTASNGPSDTVTIDALGADGSDIDEDTASATCPLRTFAASFSVIKQCAADLEDIGSNLAVKINVNGSVCNTGEVTLTNLTLADDPDMLTGVSVTLTPVSTTLAPSGQPGDCTTYTGSYYPDTIPAGDICPFADQVEAKAKAPINSAGAGCTLLGDGTSECKADSNTATCNLRAVNGDADCSTGPLSPLP
ncbi:hypothetical protein FCL40_08010 [Ferrimonas sediminicola]|uniref:Uncharacterized protein n=1 Tax=Ferrimonas sediminicola TaxID=2569538 RepID=A0A4U1BDT0_9GAMM|nr:hypothetical protein [Ferrimonas sediminicola]TKB49273.1 hypothetical protein FCL40_08010 [Ferrimonas sediminicola]